MASSLKNLSSYDPKQIPLAEDMKFAVVVSEWNEQVTFALRDGCIETLKKHGAKDENIRLYYVPGSFELIAASKMLAKTDVQSVIALGCVIKGDTPHFDYVCSGVTQGLAALNGHYKQSFIFGLLTTNNLQQALDRAGGKLGNKGVECAVTAIKMIALSKELA